MLVGKHVLSVAEHCACFGIKFMTILIRRHT